MDHGNSGYGTAIIGDVSGTTITYSSEYVFNSADTRETSVAALSETKFVVAYMDHGNSGYGTAIIGDVFLGTISYSSEYVFNSADTHYISVAALTSTKFVVAYSDTGNPHYGTAVIGNISGNSITYGVEYVFNTADTEVKSVVALRSTKFVVAYQDQGNFLYGTAVIGDAHCGSVIGIARESGTAGQTVPVIIGGVSDVHSYLAPGTIYYSDGSGALTTTVTDDKIGLAISENEILLQMQTP